LLLLLLLLINDSLFGESTIKVLSSDGTEWFSLGVVSWSPVNDLLKRGIESLFSDDTGVPSDTISIGLFKLKLISAVTLLVSGLIVVLFKFSWDNGGKGGGGNSERLSLVDSSYILSLIELIFWLTDVGIGGGGTGAGDCISLSLSSSSCRPAPIFDERFFFFTTFTAAT